jgi:glycosyltransferase involved in cell wall biosynthesis
MTYIALPAMNESDNIEAFVECCLKQTYSDFILVVCVNQPDDWWEGQDKVNICNNNQSTLRILNKIKDIPIVIIDRCSKGKGWKGKDFGVGWARKTAMDHINKQAEANDIMVSLDADTRFNPGYFESIKDNFKHHPDAAALSVPYYHELTGDDQKDRAILRYEIYMRYYAINLWRIGSPYNFTAIGSAMALPVWAYRAIGGITPHKSGEDFYFIQKLRKYGNVLTWNKEKVYPAARYSDRVFFGTGPAMIKGRDGDWSSYPIYPFELFDEVKATYDLFPVLFEKIRQSKYLAAAEGEL